MALAGGNSAQSKDGPGGKRKTDRPGLVEKITKFRGARNMTLGE